MLGSQAVNSIILFLHRDGLSQNGSEVLRDVEKYLVYYSFKETLVMLLHKLMTPLHLEN